MNNILINRIKKILTEQNMSKADLSRLTGISNSSLSEYLNGKYEPKQDKIALIAKALHVSPAWLMGFDEEPNLNRRDEREIFPLPPLKERMISKTLKPSKRPLRLP